MRLGYTSTVDSNFAPSTLTFFVLVQLSTLLGLKPVACFFWFQPVPTTCSSKEAAARDLSMVIGYFYLQNFIL